MQSQDLVCIVCVRNAQKWIKKCLASIQVQDYLNWSCIIIDDASDDETKDKILDFVQTSQDERFRVIFNIERMYALHNIYTSIYNYCVDLETVIALVDGDDWLVHSHVFSRVMQEYNNGTHVVYTQFVSYPKNSRGWCRPPFLPLRNPGYCTHLRTFKRKLFMNIATSDLQKDGKFFKYCYDKAIMYPICEMAGIDRIAFVDEVCYVYNESNPSNIHKSPETFAEQTMLHEEILRKSPYQRSVL
jgi:glycosyltransferase involved in cell wall biosynthesis